MTANPEFLPVYADWRGRLAVAGDLIALGANGLANWQFAPDLAIPLPDQASLLLLPGRSPLALDPDSGDAMVIGDAEEPATAVAAALPIGYTRLLLPSFDDSGQGPLLPLFGYTAVASYRGRIYAAAMRTDDPRPWTPQPEEDELFEACLAERRAEFPRNRILEQLAHCSLDYGCRTARNLILRRGEAGLPAARTCNAACLGCISEQPAECCPSPQARLTFTPTMEELAEIAVAHLAGAPGAIVSFGQGCEGEPLTVAPLLRDAIREIRRRTGRGLININTNAGLTQELMSLIEAGLGSARISLFSALPGDYQAYHRPDGFGLPEVRASIARAIAAGCQVSLNLLVYPGYTDSRSQTEALVCLCRETGLADLQLRNLNIDPRLMRPFLRDSEAPGMRAFLDRLREQVGEIRFGSYTKGR